MRVEWQAAFVDVPERAVGPVGAFWCAVTASALSTPQGDHGEHATFEPLDGDPYLRVQGLRSCPPGVHVDLHVEDLTDAADEAVERGVTERDRRSDIAVLGSPGGLPFCLVRPGTGQVRPVPQRWPGGQASLLDQVCLDIPSAGYDREVAFWSDLTGWPVRGSSEPEVLTVARPRSLPLRFLLQRLDDASIDDRVAAHLDLACDDRTPEVERHRAAGATLRAKRSGWTTLVDPAGAPYCVTDRDPVSGLRE